MYIRFESIRDQFDSIKSNQIQFDLLSTYDPLLSSACVGVSVLSCINAQSCVACVVMCGIVHVRHHALCGIVH
jgi:hypothetical protein